MPHQTLATVLSNEEVAPAHYVITCAAPSVAQEARPGHFVNARIAEDGYDPLLRKPFSVYTADRERGEISLLYSVVGATTRGMMRNSRVRYWTWSGRWAGGCFSRTRASGSDTSW